MPLTMLKRGACIESHPRAWKTTWTETSVSFWSSVGQLHEPVFIEEWLFPFRLLHLRTAGDCPCGAAQKGPRWFSVPPGSVGVSLYFYMNLGLLVLFSGVKNL